MTEILPEEDNNQHIYAAIDLGSNSFHMIIAREVHGQIQVIDKHKEMVRLRSGLDKKGYLTEAAFESGIECLQRFGQLIKNVPGNQIRAVGTNTLRNAKNSSEFLRQASLALGHEIQIIAGQEEARLIYLGVAHDLPHNEETRLVMDIGGGSTEYIIGKQFSYQHLTSTEMGCVSITQRFFSKPEITEKRFNKATSACQQILRPHKIKLRHYDWDFAIGASGTIKSIGTILEENNWAQGCITLPGLIQVKQAMIAAETLDKIAIAGLKEERLPVLAGGLAILIASFEVLNIEQLNISNNALREGLVFDTLGRLYAEDVRETSVKSIQAWLKIDTNQADAVADTSARLYKQAHNSWQLHDMDHDFKKLLNWAARLHEGGMALSYKRYRHHSAYLIENAELAGFTQQEKQMLSALLINHRGKFIADAYDRFESVHREKLLGLTVLLRLAVRIHRGRETDIPTMLLIIESDRTLHLEFENDWLKTHPLTLLDLDVEAQHLTAAGFQLSYA